MEKLGRHRAGLVPENWAGKRIYILARFICGAVNPLTVNLAKKKGRCKKLHSYDILKQNYSRFKTKIIAKIKVGISEMHSARILRPRILDTS